MIELLGESGGSNRKKNAVPCNLKTFCRMGRDEQIGLWKGLNGLRYMAVNGAEKTGGQVLLSRLAPQVSEKRNDRGGGAPST